MYRHKLQEYYKAKNYAAFSKSNLVKTNNKILVKTNNNKIN